MKFILVALFCLLGYTANAQEINNLILTHNSSALVFSKINTEDETGFVVSITLFNGGDLGDQAKPAGFMVVPFGQIVVLQTPGLEFDTLTIVSLPKGLYAEPYTKIRVKKHSYKTIKIYNIDNLSS